MVVELSPWSGRLGRKRFFPFKNRTPQSYGPYISASINVKTVSPDPADFAMPRPIIHRRVLAIRAMVGATVGISRPSQRDMPMD
jgi:hypothetical protein